MLSINVMAASPMDKWVYPSSFHDVFLQLLANPKYQSSQRISLFLSMSDEVQTLSILKHSLEAHKHCFIPRYVGPKMDMVRLHSMEDYDALPETAWKIKQPADEEAREDALETGGIQGLGVGVGAGWGGVEVGVGSRGWGWWFTILGELSKCVFVLCQIWVWCISDSDRLRQSLFNKNIYKYHIRFTWVS